MAMHAYFGKSVHKLPITGIVLAGGDSNRFEMGDKRDFLLSDVPCMRRAVRELYRFCSEVLIVARKTENVSETGPITVPDGPGPKGTVNGAISGLRAARHEWSLIIGADMPFPCFRIADDSFHRRSGSDLVLLQHKNGWRVPFHGLYHRGSVGVLGAEISSGNTDLDGHTAERLGSKLRIRTIPYPRILEMDPGLHCFFNMDTLQDAGVAKALLNCARTENARVIGIDGPSGAGKTTLIRSVLETRTDTAAIRPFSKGNGLTRYAVNIRNHARNFQWLLLDRTLLSSVCRDVFDERRQTINEYDANIASLWDSACHYVVMSPSLRVLLARRKSGLAEAELIKRNTHMKLAVSRYGKKGVPITVCGDPQAARHAIRSVMNGKLD